ncbi:hypothetical protein VCO01S_00300 [Vibrio comitans NBRC 102076]|uniref:Sulfatase N-terminal domain-containing protein n=1 Tax=Vibrio comitans NBRC 102076 TaxID=1219078 RepID=A0A4Y3IHG2_9VIBR|nr:hypothetical protein VCO01S_00300 [Vibrio comitans NBRC 102076]
MAVPYFENATVTEIGLAVCSGVIWIAFGFLAREKQELKLLCLTLLLTLSSIYTYQSFFAIDNEVASALLVNFLWLLLLSLQAYTYLKVISWLAVVALIGVSCTLFLGNIYYGSLDKELIFAIMQTNTAELAEYLRFLLDAEAILVIAVSFSLLIIWLHYATTTSFKAPLLSVCLVFLSGYTLLLPNGYLGIKAALAYAEQYHYELEQLQKVIHRRTSNLTDYQATTNSNGSLHVLVIGESLSRFHLNNYGYRRNTTPWINRSDPVVFEHAYSSHTHTMEVLSQALTQSNQYNKLDYYRSASLIDVLNQVGFQTAWISNQISAGIWDNLVSALAQESNYVRFINTNVGKSDHTRKLDDALINEFEAYLSHQDLSQDHFIVLHMMGSHINYCDRIKGAELSIASAPNYLYLNKENECYDKTVLFTDKVLEQIHHIASKTPYFTSMTFLSDHGEEVFEGLGHDARKFKETMAEIPMFIWPGNNMHLSKLETLKSHRNRIFSNDLLFDTILGLTDVNTPVKSNDFDISSSQFHLPISEAKTMHSSVPISSLPLFQAQNNLLKVNNLMAHRVNTIGAMDDAYKQGFKGIELDVIFDGDSNTIVVGHDKGTLSGLTLKQYMDFEKGRFNAIWLDFKNIDETNLESVFLELESLDKQYSLKKRSLLETSSTSPKIRQLSQAKWKTSYYLPTKEYIEISASSSSRIKKSKQQLFEQLSTQEMTSLSFDSSLLKFVQAHLPEVTDTLNLELNTWTSLQVADELLKSKLNQAGLLNDQIKRVIVVHQSRFKL